jgi:hypothetical protein
MLAYGNPNRTLLPYLNQESYLDSLLDELKGYDYPDNNSQYVIDEINTLITKTNSVTENVEVQEAFKIYDTGFEKYIADTFLKVGVEEDILAILMEIRNDIMPLVIKLKYHYQRIRPNQLACMLKMPLYVYKSLSADTPSYPSAHTLQSKLYCEVLGNRYPEYYKKLQDLAQNISDSRLYMGLHYPSDCEFALYIAETVINNADFKRKYQL